ncbi:exported hypothetical protein [Frankia sp. AgKG'84/4]
MIAGRRLSSRAAAAPCLMITSSGSALATSPPPAPQGVQPPRPSDGASRSNRPWRTSSTKGDHSAVGTRSSRVRPAYRYRMITSAWWQVNRSPGAHAGRRHRGGAATTGAPWPWPPVPPRAVVFSSGTAADRSGTPVPPSEARPARAVRRWLWLWLWPEAAGPVGAAQVAGTRLAEKMGLVEETNVVKGTRVEVATVAGRREFVETGSGRGPLHAVPKALSRCASPPMKARVATRPRHWVVGCGRGSNPRRNPLSQEVDPVALTRCPPRLRMLGRGLRVRRWTHHTVLGASGTDRNNLVRPRTVPLHRFPVVCAAGAGGGP